MGRFDTHGGYFAPRGYYRVDTGGSHAENPNGGVQIGVDQQGVPNMLEQGEPVYNDFVFSDNIKLDEAQAKQFGIPKKFIGKLFSDIADKYVDEAADRPNDPVSGNGLDAMLSRLAQAQEAQKLEAQKKEMQALIDSMTPEEQEQLLAGIEAQAAGQQEAEAQPADMQSAAAQMQGQVPADAMMQQPEMAQQYVEAPMQNVYQQPVMACGGPIMRAFPLGGLLRDPNAQPDIIDRVAALKVDPYAYPGRYDKPLVVEHPLRDIIETVGTGGASGVVEASAASALKKGWKAFAEELAKDATKKPAKNMTHNAEVRLRKKAIDKANGTAKGIMNSKFMRGVEWATVPGLKVGETIVKKGNGLKGFKWPTAIVAGATTQGAVDLGFGPALWRTANNAYNGVYTRQKGPSIGNYNDYNYDTNIEACGGQLVRAFPDGGSIDPAVSYGVLQSMPDLSRTAIASTNGAGIIPQPPIEDIMLPHVLPIDYDVPWYLNPYMMHWLDPLIDYPTQYDLGRQRAWYDSPRFGRAQDNMYIDAWSKALGVELPISVRTPEEAFEYAIAQGHVNVDNPQYVQSRQVADTARVAPSADTLQVIPHVDTTNAVSSVDTVRAGMPTDTVRVVSPVDITRVMSPADTLQVATPADTTNVTSPIDTARVVSPADSLLVAAPIDIDTIRSAVPVDTLQSASYADTTRMAIPADSASVAMSPAPADSVQAPTASQASASTEETAQFKPWYDNQYMRYWFGPSMASQSQSGAHVMMTPPQQTDGTTASTPAASQAAPVVSQAPAVPVSATPAGRTASVSGQSGSPRMASGVPRASQSSSAAGTVGKTPSDAKADLDFGRPLPITRWQTVTRNNNGKLEITQPATDVARVQNGGLDIKSALDERIARGRAKHAEQEAAKNPTWLRYAGALNAGLLGLYDAFQKPDEYTVETPAPVLPVARMELVNPVYTPTDRNQTVNNTLAQTAATLRTLRNSGLGPSRGAYITAADYNGGLNIGNARAQADTYNAGLYNDVVSRRNANAQTLGQYYNANSQQRAGILNNYLTARSNAGLQQQQLNYGAEGQYYQALQNQLDTVANALAGIGSEIAQRNMLLSPYLDYQLNGDFVPVFIRRGTNQNNNKGK